MTVKEIIDGIFAKQGLPEFPADKTCDKLISGSYDMEVKKAATTFMATVDVIRRAAEQGVNFIITHEPTWFTGTDDTEWVKDDPVYLEKLRLLEENHIAVWRCHDHMHMAEDDGIYAGFDAELDWGKYRLPKMKDSEIPLEKTGTFYEIPETTTAGLAAFFKERLDMDVIQIVGNPDSSVKRVGVFVGGGSLGFGVEKLPMEMMRRHDLDTVVCGDITEWTLSAYVRDAAMLGMNKSMIVLGHERSEEPGMKHMAEWMRSITGDTEVVFIDAGEPFQYLK